MNSQFNGMPKWDLSVELKCPSTKGFVGLTMVPGKMCATTTKDVEKEKK